MLENQAVESSGPAIGTASTVRVLFPDLHGVPRGKDVPVSEFDHVADHGICFCSAVMGTDLRHTPVVGGEEGYPDMRAVPDMSTLTAVPWEPGVSAVIADLQRVGEDRAEPTDPRGALRRAVAEFEELGYSPIIGPELEFFLCRADESEPPRFSRYVDRLSMVYTVGPQADPDGIVRKLTETLASLGMETFAVNHEFSNSQYEINLREAPALKAADRAFLLKSAVKDVAVLNGLVATFMGKPFNDQGGSGFHVHVSLERDGVERLRRQGRSRRDQRAHAIVPGRRAAPRARADGPAQPDGQRLPAHRPGLAGADPRELGLGQPDRDGPDPAGARRGDARGGPRRRRQRQRVPHRRRHPVRRPARRARVPAAPAAGRR